jgi:hypothetical protein
MQQCTVYILYCNANLLHLFRVPFTLIIRSTGNCNRRPLVQVIRHKTFDGVVNNPLESIYILTMNTL